MYWFTASGRQSGAILRQYQSEWAFFPIDQTKPHIASLVFDSCDAPPGGLVLRSDVDYAIQLIKFRLRRGRHTNHHTKPVCQPAPPSPMPLSYPRCCPPCFPGNMVVTCLQVIIYTIERESHARITQAYLDSTTHQLVLRQSRQLNIAGPVPTDDAFTFVRWMATVPTGATAYVDEEDPEGEDEAAAQPPDMAPRLLLLGCA